MNVRQMAWMFACITVAAFVVLGVWWWNRGVDETTTLVFATGPKNGTFQTLGDEIARIVHDVDNNIEVRTRESEGSVDNMTLLHKEEVDIAIVQNDTEPLGDIQTLIPLHRGVCHFLVPEGSDIQDIYSLAGKRVAVGKSNSGNLHIVRAMLDHFGVGFESFEPVYEGITEFGNNLTSPDIDAALFITATASPSLTELVKGGRVRYVSLGSLSENNEVDGFAVSYPYVEPYTIPRFVYPVADSRHGKPERPCASFALRSSLVCRGDLPDSVARTIVEAIVTNRANLMRSHHEARDITEHFDPRDIQFPIHHGATAYFQRQRPGFLERFSEPMAFILSLILAICGMGAGFNKWLTLRKKNRIDRYYELLDELLDEVAKADSEEVLDKIEEQLIATRHEAVRELVNERLLADDSFQIFQSLLTNCHQQLMLQRRSRAGDEIG